MFCLSKWPHNFCVISSLSRILPPNFRISTHLRRQHHPPFCISPSLPSFALKLIFAGTSFVVFRIDWAFSRKPIHQPDRNHEHFSQKVIKLVFRQVDVFLFCCRYYRASDFGFDKAGMLEDLKVPLHDFCYFLPWILGKISASHRHWRLCISVLVH